MLKLISLLFTLLIWCTSCRSTKAVYKFNDLIESSSHSVVKLRTGNFYIKRTIEIPSNVTIVGNNTNFIFNDESIFPLFRVSESRNSTLRNINVVGSLLSNELSDSVLEEFNYKYLFELNNSSNISIDNCSFSKSYGTVLKINDSQKINVINCEFKDIGVSTRKNVPYSYDGIFVGGYKNTSEVYITSCQFKNIGCSFPTINEPWPNDGDGVHVQGVGSVSNVNIKYCEFIECSARGVKIQSGKNINVYYNKFQKCTFAVNLAMAKPTKQVNISNNVINNCVMALGSDGRIGVPNVSDLKISSNIVDSCEYFFRTSGNSIVTSGVIENNRVEKIGTYFLLGRFLRTTIKGNIVKEYATFKDKSYNMAIYLSPESDNVQINDNSFTKNDKSNQEIINKSIKKVLVQRNEFLKRELNNK